MSDSRTDHSASYVPDYGRTTRGARWRLMAATLGVLAVGLPTAMAAVCPRVHIASVGALAASVGVITAYRLGKAGSYARCPTTVVLTVLYAALTCSQWVLLHDSVVEVYPTSSFCSQRLRSISICLQMYVNEHGGELPEQLSDALAFARQNVRVASTVEAWCPARDTATDLTESNVGQYVYLGRGKTLTGDRGQVLLYEPLSNHEGRGINVMYGDLSVRWLDVKQATSLLMELKEPMRTTQDTRTEPGRVERGRK